MHLVKPIVQPVNLCATNVDTLGTGNQNAGEVLPSEAIWKETTPWKGEKEDTREEGTYRPH